MAASKPLLREGYLLKRQRGKSPNADLKKLRFQQRYITLDENILDYFDQKKGTKRGSFPIKRIKIIEVVPYETFGKLFCFQVGDEDEVMYFRTKSEKIRKEWMEAFRIASVTLNKNDMCDWYHTGAFGKVNARWSCCCAEKRESKGCRRTTNTQRSRPASLSTQWEHVSSTEEQDSKADPLSESVPAGHSATCNWGDEEVQNEIGYRQSLELEDLESETSHLGEKNLSPNDNDIDLGNRADSVGSQARRSHSIDSGLDDVGVRARAGSQGSNFSTKGYSLSPASYRRRKTPLQEASSLAENVNAIPESDVTSSFKTESTIISSVFRGTQTLITASQDACVYVTDVTEYASLQDQEQTSSTAVGSVDVWKKYLAIGFPNIKLVDLDTKEKKDFLRSSSAEGDKSAQFVTFTPGGELLSYESDSSIVHVWPQVTSMWSNIPDTEVKPHLLILEGVQEIQSLSVSPDPEDPLIATVIKSTGVDERELRIYNYKTEELKQKVTLKESANKPIAVFHPFDKFVAVGNGQSLLLYFIQKGSLLQLEEFDQSITSLCFYPTGSHLTIGLSSGEVKSYKGLSSAPDLELVASHSKPGDQDPASATSITYSKDCNILSVGYSNGKVHLWQVPLIPTLIVQTNHEVHLLREKEMKVTSEGAQFVSQDDGYIISAAPGAVSKGSSVTLRHGVLPHGAFDQFEFPKGVYPVSAILSVQPTSDWKFLKPINIALPHFMSCETEDDCTKLIVLKACHVTDENGVSKYRFKKMPKKNLTLFSVRDKKNGMVWPYVSYSSDHCCYWCVGTYNKSDTDKAMFCLTEAKPKSTEAVESREFHFCLSYYLPTCIQAVEEQYPCSEYKMKHLAVTFSDEKDPVISIQFECKVNGWSFKLQGGNKIYKKDLCFLDYPSCPVLVKMCKDRQYPPRFILEVDAHEATKSICTKVAFPGVKEYFKRATPSSDIKLNFSPQGIQHSNSTCTPRRLLLSSGSDPFTPGSGEAIPHQHPFQSAMADFTDVPPKKLAFYLFTKGIITVDDYEMTKKLSMDSNADTEELNMDTLVKAYRVLKSNPQKIQGICFALKKVKSDEAQKLTKECETYEKLRTKFSRSGSAESSSSFLGGGYVSASERLSEPDVDTVAVETECGDGGDNHYPVEQPAGHYEYSTPAMESTPIHDTSSHSLTQSNWPLTCTMPTIIDSTTLSGIAPFLAPCTGNENFIPSSNANS